MEKEKKRACEERQTQGEVIFSLSLSAHAQSSLLRRQLGAEVPAGSCCSSGSCRALSRSRAQVAGGEGGPGAAGARHGPWLCFGPWEGTLGGSPAFSDLRLGLWCARWGRHPSGGSLTARALRPGSLSPPCVGSPSRR